VVDFGFFLIVTLAPLPGGRARPAAIPPTLRLRIDGALARYALSSRSSGSELMLVENFLENS
jgi:hypothetical protein